VRGRSRFLFCNVHVQYLQDAAIDAVKQVSKKAYVLVCTKPVTAILTAPLFVNTRVCELSALLATASHTLFSHLKSEFLRREASMNIFGDMSLKPGAGFAGKDGTGPDASPGDAARRCLAYGHEQGH
jgi:hypothetical protein